MRREIVEHVKQRANDACEVCGGSLDHLHHIINGSGKRKQCETKDSVMGVCVRCHEMVHRRRELDLYYKQKLQAVYAKQGKNEDEIRRLMGGKMY